MPPAVVIGAAAIDIPSLGWRTPNARGASIDSPIRAHATQPDVPRYAYVTAFSAPERAESAPIVVVRRGVKLIMSHKVIVILRRAVAATTREPVQVRVVVGAGSIVEYPRNRECRARNGRCEVGRRERCC